MKSLHDGAASLESEILPKTRIRKVTKKKKKKGPSHLAAAASEPEEI